MSERFSGTLQLTVVSDYVCPWCYIGLTRVEQLQQDYDVAVEWMPYELRPNTPAEGIPFDRLRGQGRYTEDYLLSVVNLASESGIAMKDRTLIPNSRPSLEAAEWARARGGFAALNRALFRAYFEDGADIGRLDVLRGVASDCDLDANDLEDALATGRYSAALEEKLAWSSVAGGAGVPYYMFKGVDPETGEARRFAFTGAQDYLVFQRVAERLGARPRPASPSPSQREA